MRRDVVCSGIEYAVCKPIEGGRERERERERKIDREIERGMERERT